MSPQDSPTRRNVLPMDVPDFVGRGPELAGLIEAAGTSTVVAVEGMAGVGKTTLAVHAAHLLTPHYPDGQLYLDLRAHAGCPAAAVEPAAALDTLLRLLDVPGPVPEGLPARAALWRSALTGRRVLVLLDDVPDQAWLGPLLPEIAGCLLLVTTRCRLTGPPRPRTVCLDVMPARDAAALLASAVGDDRPRADPIAAAETVALCGNLPVAIRIAGARLRHRPAWTMGQLARLLRDEHRRLVELQAEDRSVPAAFAMSYRQLRPQLQRLFRLLGLVPGPEVDADAAAALAGLEPPAAAVLLGELRDRHLIGQPVPGRYAFHELMRQHARAAALAEEPESALVAAVTRLLDYYLERSSAAAKVLAPHQYRFRDLAGPATSGKPAGTRLPAPASPNRALDWMETELDTLLAAVGLAARHGWPGHAWRLACCLAHLCYVRGHADAWLSALETGLAAARESADTDGEACVLTALGVAYEHTANNEQAADCQRRCVVLFQELGDRAGEATAIRRLGNAHLRLGHIGQALGLYQRAHAFFRDLGDRHGMASSLNNIGVAHQAFGRLPEALEYYQSALAVYQEEDGDLHDQGLLMSNIGSIQTRLERYDEALASHRQARVIARELGDRWREGTALSSIGTVYRHLGQYEAAVAYHTEALLLLREVAHPGAQSEVANDLAETHRAAGDRAMAFHHHDEAVKLARRAGERRQEARALDGQAHLYRSGGEPAAAIEFWRQALVIYRDLDLPEADEVQAHLATIAARAHR
jgi:tetratricopeptide (TPR) repeat protein